MLSKSALLRSPVVIAAATTACLAVAGFAASSSTASAAGTTAAGKAAAAKSRPAAAPRHIPPALKVPDPHAKRVAVLKGKGVQVYTCVSGRWTLLEPAATLYRHGKAVGLHTRGPEWVSTVDGSAVTGTAVASVPKKTAVPELLLKATSNRGTGTFGKVTYIQRLHTKGGLAPAGSCSSTRQLAVPYSALYTFYAPAS